MPEAIVYIDGEIVSSIDENTTFPCVTLAHVRDQLEWQRPFDSIRAKLNGPGGSANEGLAIRDYLKSFGVPLHTEGFGVVASILTSIFAAGDTRQLSKHCKFFIHLPYGGINGTADEILAYGEATKQLENELIDIYEKVTGQPREALVDLCRKQTELTAQQALDYGFATSVAQEVSAKLTDLPMAKTKQQINQNEKMNNEDKKEIKGWFDKFEEKLNKLIGRKEVKALALTLEDGRGVTIDGDTETAQEGQSVTLTDGGEALADGTYKLSNGQTITVADGKITAVTTEEAEAEKADSDEVKALKERLDALEKENGELKTAKEGAEQKAQQAEVKAKKVAEDMKALATDVETMKAAFESKGLIPRDENTKREETKASATDSATEAYERMKAKREERKNKKQ